MKIDKLIKELLKRQEFLESIDYTQQTLGRLKELNLVILIVKQLSTNLEICPRCGDLLIKQVNSSNLNCVNCGLTLSDKNIKTKDKLITNINDFARTFETQIINHKETFYRNGKFYDWKEVQIMYETYRRNL